MKKLSKIYNLKNHQEKLINFITRIRRAKKSILISLKSLKFFMERGTHSAKLITLTFKDIMEFRKCIVSKGLNTYLTNLRLSLERQLSGRKDFFYIWILEVQDRVVPHIHILLVLPKNIKIKYPDKSNWHWGDSNIKDVDFKTFRIILYMMKSFKYKKDLEKIILPKCTKKLFEFLITAPYLLKLDRKIRIFGISSRLKEQIFYIVHYFKEVLRRYLRKVYEYKLFVWIERYEGKYALDIIVYDKVHDIKALSLENEFKTEIEYLKILLDFSNQFILS